MYFLGDRGLEAYRFFITIRFKYYVSDRGLEAYGFSTPLPFDSDQKSSQIRQSFSSPKNPADFLSQ